MSESYNYTSNYFSSFNGNEKLYFQKHSLLKESSDKKIALIGIHDSGLYHIQFENFKEYLKEQKINLFDFYCLDLKGHGLSSGVRHHVNSADDFSLDLANFLNLQIVLKECDIYLMGLGTGANVILNLLYFHYQILKVKNIRGVILVDPTFFYSLDENEKRFIKLGHFLLDENSKIKINSSRCGHDLTTDQLIAEKYNADPLVEFSLPFSLLNANFNIGKKVINYSYFLDTPTLIFTGERPQKGLGKFTKGVQKGFLEHIELEKAKHDILNEKDRKKCFNHIIEWLERTSKC